MGWVRVGGWIGAYIVRQCGSNGLGVDRRGPPCIVGLSFFHYPFSVCMYVYVLRCWSTVVVPGLLELVVYGENGEGF